MPVLEPGCGKLEGVNIAGAALRKRRPRENWMEIGYNEPDVMAEESRRVK